MDSTCCNATFIEWQDPRRVMNPIVKSLLEFNDAFEIPKLDQPGLGPDELIELRIKFGVHGMHGKLTHKTPLQRSGPNSKKLAESRWKTLLPLEISS